METKTAHRKLVILLPSAPMTGRRTVRRPPSGNGSEPQFYDIAISKDGKLTIVPRKEAWAH